jgi:hypothetical protein
VLSLIEVIAFLHQHCRARNTFGQLEATVDDYAVARRLVLGPLHTAIGLVTDHARYIEFEKRLPKGEFDSNKAMNEMKTSSRKVTHDVLKKLAAMGVVQCVAKSEGNKPARWRRTGRTIDELILPSIATIRAATVTALPKPKNGK